MKHVPSISFQNSSNKNILITGAYSGIGNKEIVAKNQANLILLSKDIKNFIHCRMKFAMRVGTSP